MAAMRSLGMSRLYIYTIFASVAFCIFALMISITCFLAPLSIKIQDHMTVFLHTYSNIAFVQEGKFLNFSQKYGNNVDLYTKKKEDSVLKNIYLHRWTTTPPSKLYSQGKSLTTQINYARKGETISRIASKQDKLKSNLLVRQKDKLPFGLKGRPLIDITPLSYTYNYGSVQNRKNYLRLSEGFSLELSNDRKSFQLIDFQNGWMDYSLNSPHAQGHLRFQKNSFHFRDLLRFSRGIIQGGITADLDTITTGVPQRTENLSELPSLSMREILHTRREEMISLSPKEIFEKYRFYVPLAMNTPQKRKIHFDRVLYHSGFFESLYKHFLFKIQKNISVPIGSLLLVILAISLGSSTNIRNKGKGGSFITALVVYFFYNVVQNLTGLSYRKNIVSYPSIVWIPELMILFAIILILFFEKRTKWSFFTFSFSKVKKIFHPSPKNQHSRNKL